MLTERVSKIFLRIIAIRTNIFPIRILIFIYFSRFWQVPVCRDNPAHILGINRVIRKPFSPPELGTAKGGSQLHSERLALKCSGTYSHNDTHSILGIAGGYSAFCIIHKDHRAQRNKEVWIPCCLVLTTMQKNPSRFPSNMKPGSDCYTPPPIPCPNTSQINCL